MSPHRHRLDGSEGGTPLRPEETGLVPQMRVEKRELVPGLGPDPLAHHELFHEVREARSTAEALAKREAAYGLAAEKVALIGSGYKTTPRPEVEDYLMARIAHATEHGMDSDTAVEYVKQDILARHSEVVDEI